MFNSPLSDRFDKIMLLGPKTDLPCGSHVLSRLVYGKHKKSSCPKPLGLEP